MSLAPILLLACSSSPKTGPDASGGDNGVLGFAPSNIDPSLLDFTGVGDVVISADQTIRTDIGGLLSGTGNYNYLELTQASGPKLGVFTVKSLTIAAGATATAVGADALVIVALDTIDVEGKLYGNSQQADGRIGPGVVNQVDQADVVGNGPGGGSPGSSSTSGAGAGYCGVGGPGASLLGASAAAGGGVSWGTPAIIPLVAGSNGGDGFGAGGDGGGAIQLVAATSITVAGVIHVGGKGGLNSGVFDGTGTLSQQAAGGGSGGSILLESLAVTVSGTLAANGGGGGGDVSGADATGDAQPATGGVADATHAAGGAGSAGATLGGQAGTSAANSTSGGGGGAAGRIRINSHTAQASLTGTLSPPLGSCATQGKI